MRDRAAKCQLRRVGGSNRAAFVVAGGDDPGPSPFTCKSSRICHESESGMNSGTLSLVEPRKKLDDLQKLSKLATAKSGEQTIEGVHWKPISA